MKVIDSFTGYYDFLSNFYPAKVTLDDDITYNIYPSIEHAYQAAKSLNPKDREFVRLANTAAIAKKRGRSLAVRDDWEDIKLDVMRKLIAIKFDLNELGYKLILTGDALLIEGNWWGDTYWGVCRSVGQNHLGKLLMQRREYIGSIA